MVFNKWAGRNLSKSARVGRACRLSVCVCEQKESGNNISHAMYGSRDKIGKISIRTVSCVPKREGSQPYMKDLFSTPVTTLLPSAAMLDHILLIM